MPLRKVLVTAGSVSGSAAALWRKTLAVVGLGRIGMNVARRARGFDMRELAVARHPDQDFATRHGVEFVTMERALAQADFVSLHLAFQEGIDPGPVPTLVELKQRLAEG